MTRPASETGHLRRRLNVVVLLKTAQGGLWSVPHVEELRRRGHTVTVLLPPGPGRLRAALGDRGVPVVDSAFSFRFRPSMRTVRELWRLRRQIRALRPDVLHYHLYASALAARLASLGTRVARVHMVAGPLYLDSPVIRSVERVLARIDHVTIGGSEHTARRYRDLGLSSARTPAIPYGVDVAEFSPPPAARRAAARARLGVDTDTFLAIMVAYTYAPKRSVHRGAGIKGHDVLLDAWRSFASRHAHVKLLLVGAGFDDAGEAYRQELMRRHRVADDPTVTWLPTVVDVKDLYAAADVSVSPSLSENHGAAVEASAMGVPCIVSDAGALPETVDQHSGWVTPRGDVGALVAALERAHAAFQAGTLAARGRQARSRMVRHFDRGAAAARVADVIEDSCRRQPAVHP